MLSSGDATDSDAEITAVVVELQQLRTNLLVNAFATYQEISLQIAMVKCVMAMAKAATAYKIDLRYLLHHVIKYLH